MTKFFKIQMVQNEDTIEDYLSLVRVDFINLIYKDKDEKFTKLHVARDTLMGITAALRTPMSVKEIIDSVVEI